MQREHTTTRQLYRTSKIRGEAVLSRAETSECEVMPAASAERRAWAVRWPLLIAAAFALLHVILAVAVDASDAKLFVRTDRAGERLSAVLGVLATRSWSELEQYLTAHGIIGDYAVHALLYWSAGRFGVVGVQVALAIVSGLCVHRLALLLGLSWRASAIAMALYLSLPHTLVLPHQLATEALHTPLLVISTWALAELYFRPRPSMLLTSALCLGAAILIRPIMLLWPFVAAAALGLAVRPRTGWIYAGVALLPTIAWMTFIGVQTGEPGLGESGHSMGRNLYDRVARIAATMPAATQEDTRAAYLNRADRKLEASAYVRFSFEHPAASLAHLGRDALNFFGKSGIERVTIDYLALHPAASGVQDPQRGWRHHLEMHGPIATARYLSQTLGSIFLVSLVGAALMAALLVLAALGAIHFFRRWRELPKPRTLTGVLLSVLVAYVFVFSQVINAMQSRHRAPAEFAIVLLAMVGSCVWREWRTRPSS